MNRNESGAALWALILREGVGRLADPDFPARLATVTTILDKRVRGGGEILDAVGWDEPIVIAPPFKQFWLEGRSDDWGMPNTTVRWGTVVETRPAEDEENTEVYFRVIAEAVGTPFWVGDARLMIDRSGSVLSPGSGLRAEQIVAEPGMRAFMGTEKAFHVIRQHCFAAVDVMSLLACSNVQLERRQSNSQAIRIARKRSGNHEGNFDYRILTVLKPGQRKDAGHVGAALTGIMPLHMSRGHIRVCGSEGRGLLFGKYAGRFYIPPCVKGKSANGTVVKDYQVDNAPVAVAV